MVYVVGMVARNPNALLGQAGHEVNLRLRDGSVSSENSDVVVLVPATASPPPPARDGVVLQPRAAQGLSWWPEL